MKLERHNIALVVPWAILIAILISAACGMDESEVVPLGAPTEAIATSIPPTLVSMPGGRIPHSRTMAINITADTFPKGMGGYIIRVSTADPTIAIPVLFTSPDYGLTDLDATSTPGSIRLAVVDLNSLVEAGASNVVLGTVTFEGVGEGNTAIVLTVEKMDSEDGFPILSSVTTGLLMVTHSQDLDGDGLTEDRNANGFFDFADIIQWFEDLLES